jgi:hypothetical protein
MPLFSRWIFLLCCFLQQGFEKNNWMKREDREHYDIILSTCVVMWHASSMDIKLDWMTWVTCMHGAYLDGDRLCVVYYGNRTRWREVPHTAVARRVDRRACISIIVYAHMHAISLQDRILLLDSRTRVIKMHICMPWKRNERWLVMLLNCKSAKRYIGHKWWDLLVRNRHVGPRCGDTAPRQRMRQGHSGHLLPHWIQLSMFLRMN